MRRVHRGPRVALVLVLVLLATLTVTVGLGLAGWLVGALAGLVLVGLVGRGLDRTGRLLGPADRITLTRAVLVCVVAALVADSFAGSFAGRVPVLVALATVALVLDAVDGQVARRTGTVSTFGARFDLETDAFLILVLSAYVAPLLGWWVLAIGLLRYLFVAAGRLLPWLRGTAPPRPWCKVVAAVQGIVLTIAAAGVLPAPVARAALLVALLLLVESFGREAWELHRIAQPVPDRAPIRRLLPVVLTVVAFALVWAALVLPDRLERITPTAFLRVPLEGLLVVALAVVLPTGWRRVLAVAAGLVLGLLVILTVLDIGFFSVLDRPFDVLNDWYYLGPGLGVLTDSSGPLVSVGVVVAAVALVAVLLVVLPWCLVRVTDAVAGQRRVASGAVAVVAAGWVVAAVAGAQLVAGEPVASRSASTLAYDQVTRARADLRDRGEFDRASVVDAYADTPGDQLLTSLRGKDVLVVFVESYGRVAVQGTSYSPGVDAVLDAGTAQLRASGYTARSAFLTSPTFGGISWLAHATLESGLWVDRQQRYDQLLTRNRTTLMSAFERAGWRTVFDDPANTKDWPQGEHFYGFDQQYDARNVGYAGPRFSYATMPDQYSLAAFGRHELTGPHRPVMAEIDLLSSHTPWTPLPHLVPWAAVGDGSVFDPMPAQGQSPGQAFRDPNQVRALYGESIQYSLGALVGFLRTTSDPNLVVVALGDHQPQSLVSGNDPGHDVPISIIARDPAVTGAISGWRWSDGLKPDPAAPVLRMDLFRDRFLAAFGPQEGKSS